MFLSNRQLLILGRALGPLGLAKAGSTSPVGVGGYGNLGVPSLACLPSTADISDTSENKSKFEGAFIDAKESMATSSTSSLQAESARSSESKGQRSGQKRAKRKHGEDRPAERHTEVKVRVPRQRNNYSSRNLNSDRNIMVTCEKLEKAIPANDDDLPTPANVLRKGPTGPKMSLASLAASAAAVAAVGAGTTNSTKCVTVRIGGIEVQVPMVTRGARQQARPIKSTSELEADMHSVVLGWDLIQSAKTCDDEKNVGGPGRFAMKKLPLRYSSLDEYEDCLTPLLMNECLEQVG